MIRRLLPALLLPALACAADPETEWQLGFDLGFAPGLIDGEIPVQHPVVGTATQDLSTEYRPGFAGGIELDRVRIDHDGDGWYAGLGLQVVRWNGSITAVKVNGAGGSADAAVSVTGGMLNVVVGGVWRWDGYVLRVMPHDWQFDAGLLLGVGYGQAAIVDSDSSDPGLLAQIGPRVRVTAAISEHWRFGGSLAVLVGVARPSWSNTDTATLTAFGPALSLLLIREF